MAEHSEIAWCDATWNCVVGCIVEFAAIFEEMDKLAKTLGLAS
jgi:protein gp37